MSGADEHDADGVAAAFLIELLADRERGVAVALADYQARYPGFEDVVAREFASLADGGVVGGEGDGDTDTDGAQLANDRYRLDGEVGRGGMATVFRAFDEPLHRHLALKRVRSGIAPQQVQRFLEEARVTAQLDHPGIVSVHDLGIDRRGQAFFTMDLVRGRTFADVIAQRDPGDTGCNRELEVLQRVCEAVAFAHDKGVIHRDLKPQNVMVGRFGEVYVMDWGLAHVRGAAPPSAEDEPAAAEADTEASLIVSARAVGDTPEWTVQGDVVGTPAYMAPEQARGRGDLDVRVDVYAIGAMLYQVLTQRMPYVDRAATESSRVILDLVVAGPPRAIADCRPDVPPELVAICERAMARDRDDRYPDVLQLRDDLRAFVEQRVVAAYEQGAWAELRKWVRRNRAITAAAAVAVLALLVGLGVSLVLRARAEAETAKANVSFADAVDAVEAMLSRVGQHKLDNVPQAAVVRREVLQDASALFEKLLARRPDDATVRRRAAGASYRLAAMHAQLGEMAEALVANERSLQLRREDVAERPDDLDAALALVETHHQASRFATRSGDFEHAMDRGRQAMRVLDGWLQRERSRRIVELAAIVQENLGVVAYRDRQTEQAAEHVGNSLALLDELAVHDDDGIRSRQAAVCVLHGAVLRRLRDREGARRAWQRGVDLLEHLYATDDDYTLRRRLAQAATNLAVGAYELRDYAAADAAIERALALHRENATAFPELPECWGSIGTVWNNVAQFQRSRRRYLAAIDAGQQAVAELGKALAMEPGNRGFRDSLWLAHRNVQRAARPVGRHAEMAANAQAMAGHAVADDAWRRNAAYWLCHASRAAGEDRALAAAARTAARARYRAAALAVLEDAMARGELTADHVEHESCAELRALPGFTALRERLAAGR